MRTLFTLVIVSALAVSAQTPAPPAEKPKPAEIQPGLAPAPNAYKVTVPVAVPITMLPAATVVATVDGEKVTAGQLQDVLRNLPPKVQQQAQNNRKEFVSQYATLLRLVAQAKKANLDQKSPWKESIAYNTMQVLYQAAVTQKKEELTVSPEEVQKYYDANKDRYAQVKIKAIYLPFNTSATSQPDSHGKALPTEADAKAKADDLVKQARAGADFVKLVKENSGDPTSVEKDGDFPPIRKSDSQIPADIKKAIFSAKQGEVTEPLRQPRGYYIFRIEEVGFEPLSEVKKPITDQLTSDQLGKWLSEIQKSIDVKMVDEPPAAAAATAPATAPAPAPTAAAPSSSAAPAAK